MPERHRIYPAPQEAELHVPVVSPTEKLLVRTPEASIWNAYKLGLLDGDNLPKLLDYSLHSLQMAEWHAQQRVNTEPRPALVELRMQLTGATDAQEYASVLERDYKHIRQFTSRGYRVLLQQLKIAHSAQAMHVYFLEFLKNYILDTPRPGRLESDEEQQKEALTEARDISATFMLKEITTVLSDILEYYVKTTKLIDTTELQTLLSHKLVAQKSRPMLLTTTLSAAPAVTE